jgi:hypothetical protein
MTFARPRFGGAMELCEHRSRENINGSPILLFGSPILSPYITFLILVLFRKVLNF